MMSSSASLMPYRPLGRTGLSLSQLGFGAMRLPTIQEGDHVRADRSKAIPMIHRAFEGGVNYIDSAVGYVHQDSQRVVGEALKSWKGHRIIVSTKNPYYEDDEKTWWTNLENSLERLQVEAIDCYHHHGINWKTYVEKVEPRVGRWMIRAKDQGLIRHICTSFHDDNAGLMKLIDTGYPESILLQYNLLDRKLEEGIAYAAQKGIGIISMGPVGGGRLVEPSSALGEADGSGRSTPDLALRFVLSNPHVSCALSGMSTMQHVEENLATAQDPEPLTIEEHAAIERKLGQLKKLADLYCTGCNYCMPCPNGVKIPEIFQHYNLARVYGLTGQAQVYYRDLVKREGGADRCIECGECEPLCPQHIPVMQQLKEVHQALGEEQPVSPSPAISPNRKLEYSNLVRKAVSSANQRNKTPKELGLPGNAAEQKRVEEALQKSEETFRAIVKSIGDAVISTDIETQIVFMNPVAEALTGWSEKEALGQPLETVFQIINEKTRNPIESPVTKALKSGKIVELTNHTLLIAKDGREIPIADSSAPIRNDAGEITGVVLVFRDQTEERAAREALESNLELLQIAGDTSAFGGWVFDLQTGALTWSDTVRDIHEVPRGYTPPIEEGINFYAPEWRGKITEVFNACVEKGIPYDEEMEIITQKGRRLWVRTCGRALRNEEGKITKVQGSFQDITEHLETQARYHMLFETMNSCVAIYKPVEDNSDFEFVDMNPAALKYSKLSGEEVIGKKVTEVFPGVKESGVFKVLQRVAETGQPEFLPMTHYEDDRIELWVENYIFKLPSELVVAIYEDVTEHKIMQAQLFQAQKMEAIGQLAGGIAHDFNNQLAGITNYADLLLSNIRDEELTGYIKAIIQSCTRSKDLTGQLLAFSRKGKYQVVPVNVHSIISEVVAMLGRSSDKRIHIQQHLNADSPMTKGDPTQLHNALLNLGLNARDAMPNGGALVFETSTVSLDAEACRRSTFDIEPGDYLRITVADSGIGMDDTTRERMFEPFYTTKAEGKGTGMGLASVYGTMVSHRGAIEVESKEGKGTTLTILLPRSQAEEIMKTSTTQDHVKAGAAHILIIDDERSVRESTAKIMQRKGYDVVTCEDGVKGVEYYKESWQEIDFVVLDMNMPVMNGRDTFAALRKINPDIKAALATGYSLDEDAQAILDDGVLFHIQKPFRILELISQIEQVLSESRSQRSAGN